MEIGGGGGDIQALPREAVASKSLQAEKVQFSEFKPGNGQMCMYP